MASNCSDRLLNYGCPRVAKWLRQRSVKPCIAGSNPAPGTSLLNRSRRPRAPIFICVTRAHAIAHGGFRGHQAANEVVAGNDGADLQCLRPVKRRLARSLPCPVDDIPRTRLVLIPAGWFLMGDEQGRRDEQPAHNVYVSEFEMAMLPVTNADYSRFIAATLHETPRFWDDPCFNAPDQPVVGVSWFEAVAYCDWLSTATGATWRLPTEAEREKAMRGGSEGPALPVGRRCWSRGRAILAGRAMAGRSVPSRTVMDLLDIASNVHEWCSDWYGRRLLRGVAGARPERAGIWQSPCVQGRRLAPSDQGVPLRRPQQPEPCFPATTTTGSVSCMKWGRRRPSSRLAPTS